MTWPGTYSTLKYGAFGVAGLGAYLGLKHGNEDDPMSERVGAGIAYTGMGAAAAAGAGALAYYNRKNLWNGTKNFATRMKANYADEVRSGAGRFKAGLHAYGTLPVLAGAGAAIGAVAAGEDHRMKGAAIGAGIGTAASVAIQASRGWSKLSMASKVLGVAPLLAAGAFGLGTHMSYRDAVAAAVPDEAGSVDYADPASVPQPGAGRRARNMNAGGNLVFGLHNGRHK